LLNSVVGRPREEDGRWLIDTVKGAAGHAVYGPYAHLAPGLYAVEFNLASRNHNELDPATVCAYLDVSRDFGNDIIARKSILFGDLRLDGRYFYLTFHLERKSQVEFRVEVLGNAELSIDDNRRVQVSTDGFDPIESLKRSRFPVPALSGSRYFSDNVAKFRTLYSKGFGVDFVGCDPILTFEGVRFFARCDDDFIFISDVLIEGTYSLHFKKPIAVVDVGMNIGLASLKFAAQPNVKRVYSFEPFEPTFRRAADNLALNTAIGSKIRARNVGLAGADQDAIFHVPPAGDSGCMTTLDVAGGTPVRVVLRKAADVFDAIIKRSREDGLEVFAKIDCEGAEYEIFESLDSADLLGAVRGFMVETHGHVRGKFHGDVVEILKRAGFVIYDRLPREGNGNGLLYAARA
jgi:FkbM family methyltransferase